MAGLLDQAQLAGNKEALAGVEDMAGYFCSRARRVIAVNGSEHWHQVLENEFGGMNEVRGRAFVRGICMSLVSLSSSISSNT
jgi:hypothetical protein